MMYCLIHCERGLRRLSWHIFACDTPVTKLSNEHENNIEIIYCTCTFRVHCYSHYVRGSIYVKHNSFRRISFNGRPFKRISNMVIVYMWRAMYSMMKHLPLWGVSERINKQNFPFECTQHKCKWTTTTTII